ncbi:MAG: uncharacterized protein K0S45_561 [Nitrospira sp.]|nr:uncharacterized protein [Nitrospira sp.]
MLRLVTGPFQPTLESALVRDLLILKTQDPQAALALIVPSDQLRRYLKSLLVLKHGLALLNVHILSFHQLALHLDRERHSSGETHDRNGRVELVTDVFFEHLLQHLGQRNVPYTEALRLSHLPPGAWAALWASLRDLKDASVDSAVALRAVEEGQFLPEDHDKLKGLFTLYAALKNGSAALDVGSPDDLAAFVTKHVAASPFLQGLTRLCYYGSYDLTQTQLTLLETLSASFEVAVYFPVNEQPVYGFARRFLERHLYPMAEGSRNNLSASSKDDLLDRQPKLHVSVEVSNCAGMVDELALVCKQILSLVETNGYRFDEIGVAGRTLVPYQTDLKRTFDQHRIPFVSSATLPLLQEPAVKTLFHLAQLKVSGLYRPAMMEVVTSPWSRRMTIKEGGPDLRPDLWRPAVEALGIHRGEDEWRRLAQFGNPDILGEQDEEQRTGSIGPLPIDAAQLRLLWGRISEVIDDVKRLPEQGGYGDLTNAFLSLAEKHLTVLTKASQPIDPASQWEIAGDLSEALSGVFTQLRELDRLGMDVTWEEWTDTLMQVLERTTYAIAPPSHRGVQVLDAMAARGLGFRALFIIGMNEKLFPRFIHEDGFLRDRHRLILSETLGYKIDQKLQGYGEETLLFELLRSSASERLYLSYQRADAAGRPLAPSTYLDQFDGLSAASATQAVFALPRRWQDRAGLALFVPPLLTREELTVSTVLQGRDVSTLLERFGRDGLLFSHGLEAQAAIESDEPALSAYDGMLAGSTSHWAKVSREGFSPTALENYARCPFRYFAGQVLGLQPMREIPSMELSPSAMGQLCHDALRLAYPALVRRGWPTTMLSEEVVMEESQRAVAQAFDAYERIHGAGYALTWQLAQERVELLVRAAIASDREEALASGFIPIGFEIDARGSLPDRAGRDPVLLRGRWDRVDRQAASGALRVIDYKYRAGDRIEAKDRSLLQAALRGVRLQPALYTLMAAGLTPGDPQGALPEQVDFLYLLPEGTPAVERVSFAASTWQGPSGPMLAKTLHDLLDGLRAGRHFILPDTYCDHCEFSTACRRAHRLSWWRAYRSSQTRGLRELRMVKVACD